MLRGNVQVGHDFSHLAGLCGHGERAGDEYRRAAVRPAGARLHVKRGTLVNVLDQLLAQGAAGGQLRVRIRRAVSSAAGGKNFRKPAVIGWREFAFDHKCRVAQRKRGTFQRVGIAHEAGQKRFLIAFNGSALVLSERMQGGQLGKQGVDDSKFTRGNVAGECLKNLLLHAPSLQANLRPYCKRPTKTPHKPTAPPKAEGPRVVGVSGPSFWLGSCAPKVEGYGSQFFTNMCAPWL